MDNVFEVNGKKKKDVFEANKNTSFLTIIIRIIVILTILTGVIVFFSRGALQSNVQKEVTIEDATENIDLGDIFATEEDTVDNDDIEDTITEDDITSDDSVSNSSESIDNEYFSNIAQEYSYVGTMGEEFTTQIGALDVQYLVGEDIMPGYYLVSAKTNSDDMDSKLKVNNDDWEYLYSYDFYITEDAPEVYVYLSEGDIVEIGADYNGSDLDYTFTPVDYLDYSPDTFSDSSDRGVYFINDEVRFAKDNDLFKIAFLTQEEGFNVKYQLYTYDVTLFGDDFEKTTYLSDDWFDQEAEDLLSRDYKENTDYVFSLDNPAFVVVES